MSKTAALSVRVSEEVKAAADKAAADNDRSTASLVERVLRERQKASAL
jgi:predicted HicB family RNase H-like nuclease